MSLGKNKTEQVSENIKAIFELKERMEHTPWIRLRNRLVTELSNKRRELGFSQTYMAEALNTSNGSITRFEGMAITKDGKPIKPPNPTVKTIASYAAALGLEIDFRLVPIAKK